MTCKHCKKEFPNDWSDDVDNCILCCDKMIGENSTEKKIADFNTQLARYIITIEPINDFEMNISNIYFPKESTLLLDGIFTFVNKAKSIIINFIGCDFIDIPNIIQGSNNERKIIVNYNDCNFITWKNKPYHQVEKFEGERYHLCRFNKLGISGDEKSHLETNIEFVQCEFDNLTINYCICNKKLLEHAKKITFLTINNSLINEPFRITDGMIIKKLDFSETEFKKTVKIKSCEITEANFYNTKFDKLADFYRTKFSNVSFKKTDFNDISVFSEVVFKCDVDFLYTKFLKEAIFQDAVITGKLNLRNSIFKDKANFLDITCEEKDKDEPYENPKLIQVANRETARIIKNFYDSSKNIIEANKFYALEMQEREKELDQNIKNNVFEWLVFKAHRLSSNHSQDWFLALFWIINLTFLYSSMRTCTSCNIPTFSFVCPVIILSLLALSLYLLFKKQQLHKLFLVIISAISYLVYAYSYHDFTLSIFAQNLNPFRNLTMLEEQEKNMAFMILMYKIIIAYLIYQFIISIRQNTKRKID